MPRNTLIALLGFSRSISAFDRRFDADYYVAPLIQCHSNREHALCWRKPCYEPQVLTECYPEALFNGTEVNITTGKINPGDRIHIPALLLPDAPFESSHETVYIPSDAQTILVTEKIILEDDGHLVETTKLISTDCVAFENAHGGLHPMGVTALEPGGNGDMYTTYVRDSGDRVGYYSFDDALQRKFCAVCCACIRKKPPATQPASEATSVSIKLQDFPVAILWIYLRYTGLPGSRDDRPVNPYIRFVLMVVSSLPPLGLALCFYKVKVLKESFVRLHVLMTSYTMSCFGDGGSRKICFTGMAVSLGGVVVFCEGLRRSWPQGYFRLFPHLRPQSEVLAQQQSGRGSAAVGQRVPLDDRQEVGTKEALKEKKVAA